MEDRHDAYCGLYCGSCTAFLATKENRIKELADEWQRPVEDVECHGCKSEKLAVYCRTCALKQCARQKGLEFCFQCAEYPCPQLDEFKNSADYPYHSEVYDYMDMIAEHGTDYWLEQMKRRWSCGSCGREHSWFTPACRECGGDLDTYKKTQ
ncbi:MAG: DUF3795 domain-containing protein [Spirochaetia bacterium]|jgi:hypothetical protein